jgi:hypothetical protein
LAQRFSLAACAMSPMSKSEWVAALNSASPPSEMKVKLVGQEEVAEFAALLKVSFVRRQSASHLYAVRWCTRAAAGFG